MILISLLLALVITRNVHKTSSWQMATYAQWYRTTLFRHRWLSSHSGYLKWGLAIVGPACLLAILIGLLGPFLTFLLQTIVLVLCLGEPRLKSSYKAYLQAAARNDIEACALYAAQLEDAANSQDNSESAQALGATFARQVVWMNYQYYTAVMLWFIIFGAPGALLYTLALCLYAQRQPEHKPEHVILRRAMRALNFVPVRLAAFGFLVVGHFTTALPVWLQYLSDLRVSSRNLLTSVAMNAESLTDESNEEYQQSVTYEPLLMVRLAKRNVLFLLVVTAVLTVLGALP